MHSRILPLCHTRQHVDCGRYTSPLDSFCPQKSAPLSLQGAASSCVREGGTIWPKRCLTRRLRQDGAPTVTWQVRRNKNKNKNVCVFKKKLFTDWCMMSVCSQSVGYTVHVSGVHFLQRGQKRGARESGIERWGTSGQDRTRVIEWASRRGETVACFCFFTPRKLYRFSEEKGCHICTSWQRYVG